MTSRKKSKNESEEISQIQEPDTALSEQPAETVQEHETKPVQKPGKKEKIIKIKEPKGPKNAKNPEDAKMTAR